MSMLALKVEKRLGEFFISARFESEGGVTGLFGASGAGKTTLVNMIAGLIAPDCGRIEIDHAALFDSAAGINVPVHRRRIGYVFSGGAPLSASLGCGKPRLRAPHAGAGARQCGD